MINVEFNTKLFSGISYKFLRIKLYNYTRETCRLTNDASSTAQFFRVFVAGR